jgi:hypothetical protein
MKCRSAAGIPESANGKKNRNTSNIVENDED